MVCSSFPSNRSFSSMVALNKRNIPPISIIRSLALNGCSNRVRIGWVSVINHERLNNRMIRITRAHVNPVIRALSRSLAGSLSARMAIKTRLSIPRTISRTIRVAKPAQIEGSAIHSIQFVLPSDMTAYTDW
ncbi:hypothetical protein HMPREF1568_2876 [Providencia alcalifaciens PAL-3]|nr:hypothetical protein HMPREF1568_2876 [Providencia alcalifaciens PAL-3]EUC99558.1 hypothetical protein HMPREF1566_2411 [Providencia alcalifaciens PAL-1]